MNADLDLSAFGLEEMDVSELVAVNGGDGFWEKIVVVVVTCLINSSDAIIDGARAGWAAAAS